MKLTLNGFTLETSGRLNVQDQFARLESKIPSFWLKEKDGMPRWLFLALLLLALICQAGAYGNPTFNIDPQYYMYGGGQILQGRIPYVDFWDRKPVGLFLLYAVFHAFGPLRWWVLPIFTAASVWTGALGLIKICRGFGLSRLPSALAGMLFILALSSRFDLLDGQAECFYLPLVIWAMAPVLCHWQRLQNGPKALFRTGCLSMALFGVAMEIKQSSAISGMLLGCTLLWLAFSGPSPIGVKFGRTISFGAVWIAVAALPTVLIAGWYWQHGYFQDWLWANVLNNAYGDKTLQYHYWHHLLKFAFQVSALTLPIFLCAIPLFSHLVRFRFQLIFLFLWSSLGIAEALSLTRDGNSLHYLAPVFPPLILLSALLWKFRDWRQFFLPFFLSLAAFKADRTTLHHFHQPLMEYKKVSSVLKQQSGCLLESGNIYNHYYDAALGISACGITKFLFTHALYSPVEHKALGIDQREEMRRALSTRPMYLITEIIPDLSSCKKTFNCSFNAKKLIWTLQHHGYPANDLIRETVQKYYEPVIYYSTGTSKIRGPVLFKLKAGLTPGITPKGIPPEPSKPIK